ncbi:tellurite resistance TerB family protein [Ancylobacter radicis]|uniref:Tellurite resistance TerB family protein n=1 Tax=Ancylobacter radicis TaxID=2836179 RepID=A0ABS5RC51_9HYPH|nr:tellurite resistance TerB family protein [Ancylobacter radicis]MBS9479238.1 tellurite resistance TerB family protein [Ancylobacter radicis]
MFNSGNFDAKRLLDQFLSPQSGSTGNLPTSTGGASLANSLGGLLGGLSGGTTSGAAQPSGSGDLLSQAKGYLSNNGGSLASGAAAGALVSLVLGNKSGRKVAKSAVALGGLALVGTLAYKAYQNYQQGGQPQQAATPSPTHGAQLPPPDSPFNPAQADRTQLPLVLLRTMIAASLADGHIDERERVAISGKLNEQGAQLDEAERFLTAEFANPATVESLAREVATPEEAAEVYMTALLAIDADTSSERAFLARLALALKLDPALTPHLEAAARSAKLS